MGDRTPMLMSIQKPERVLNILRNSTLTSRVAGMGRGVRRAGAASVVVAGGTIVAVMPPLLWVVVWGGWPAGRSWRSCRNSFALSVGGEREKHVFEAGALGRPELGEGDAGGQGHSSDPSGGGIGGGRAVAGERAGDPSLLECVSEVAR